MPRRLPCAGPARLARPKAAQSPRGAGGVSGGHRAPGCRDKEAEPSLPEAHRCPPSTTALAADGSQGHLHPPRRGWGTGQDRDLGLRPAPRSPPGCLTASLPFPELTRILPSLGSSCLSFRPAGARRSQPGRLTPAPCARAEGLRHSWHTSLHPKCHRHPGSSITLVSANPRGEPVVSPTGHLLTAVGEQAT